MKAVMVFIRKLLYVVFCYLLIRFAVDGYGFQYTVKAEIFLVGACIIMKPTNWEKGLINWEKIFGEEKAEKTEE